MKIIAIVSVLMILSLVSCKKSPKIRPSVYDFEVINTAEIVLDESDRAYLPAREQFVEIDGANVLIFNIGNRKLSFYDIDKGLKNLERTKNWIIENKNWLQQWL